MKFRWRLALALCLILACLGSVARAEGDFSVTAEEMMLGVIRSAACTESAVYALGAGEIRAIDSETWEQTAWELELEDLAGDLSCYLECIMPYGGELFALAYAYEDLSEIPTVMAIDQGKLSRASDIAIERGGLYRVRFEESRMVCTLESVAELDVEAFYAHYSTLRQPVLCGNKLFGIADAPTGGELLWFDLESGEYAALSRRVLALAHHGEEAILFAESGDEGVLLRKLWLDSMQMEDVRTLSAAADDFGNLCYSAGEDAVYFAQGKTVYRANLAQGGAPEPVRNIFTESYSRNVPWITSGGYLLTADYECVAKSQLSAQAEGTVLTIAYPADYLTLDAEMNIIAIPHPDMVALLDAAQHRFLTANPGAAVIVSHQNLDLAQALLTQSSSSDIFIVHTQDAAYADALAQGYMRALDSAALAEYAQGMYSSIQGSIMREGTLYALPLAVAFEQSSSYSPAAFAALGLQPPQTWPEYLALLGELPDLLAGREDIAISEQSSDQFARAALSQLVRQYAYEALAQGVAPDFEAEAFRALLAQFEAVDFARLAPWCGGEGEVAHVLFADAMDFDIRVRYRIPVGGARDKGEGIPLLLSTGAQNPRLLPVDLTVAFVNPYSQQSSAAIALLESLRECTDIAVQMQFCPGMNEPVPDENTPGQLAAAQQEVAEWEALIAETTDEADLVTLEGLLASAQETVAWLEGRSWVVSAESIAQYRTLAENLWVKPWSPLEDGAMYDILDEYLHGVIPGDVFVARLNSTIAMAVAEG